jgi:hypothetical protein
MITSVVEWAAALDEEIRRFRVTDYRVCSSEAVMWAFASGSAAGVEIARAADDNGGRRLISADGHWSSATTS